MPTPFVLSDSALRTIMSPAGSYFLVVLPDRDFTIIGASESYLALAGGHGASPVGRALFDTFPYTASTADGDASTARTALALVLQPYSSDATCSAGLADTQASNLPVRDPNGKLRYIIHRLDPALLHAFAFQDDVPVSAVPACAVAGAEADAANRQSLSMSVTATRASAGWPNKQAPATLADTAGISRRIGDIMLGGISRNAQRAPASSTAMGSAAAYCQVSGTLAREQAAAVFAHTNEAIIITDARRRIVNVNQAFTSISGYLADEVLGHTPFMLRSGRHDDAFYAAIMNSLTSTGQWQGEMWNRRKNGELFPVWENISLIRADDGAIQNYVAIFSDISVIKQTLTRLDHLAHHDPLTQLPNRARFSSIWTR